MTSDTKKRMAAAKALDYIDDGMVVGLGTGVNGRIILWSFSPNRPGTGCR